MSLGWLPFPPVIASVATRVLLTAFVIPPFGTVTVMTAFCQEVGYRNFYYLDLTSGAAVNGTTILNTSIGGATRWIQLTLPAQALIITATGPTTYALAAGVDLVLCSTSAGAVGVTLPATPSTGQKVDIKDSTGNSPTNNITINGNGKNIDGQATFLINVSYGSVTLMYNGAEWSIV